MSLIKKFLKNTGLKFFSKEEFIVVSLIFAVVVTVTLINMQASLMRARDSTRRGDMGGVSNALGEFYEDFGFFPPSEDGKIKYCKGDNFEEVVEQMQGDTQFDKDKFFEGLRACEWGQDSFVDLTGERKEPYLVKMPLDPYTEKGVLYNYVSNTRLFQIYTHLEEGEDAIGYNLGITQRELSCGEKTCNYGRSFAQTPLDMSLEEYEALLEKERLESLGQ